MNSLSNIKIIKLVYVIIFASLAFWSIFAFKTLNDLINEQKIYATLINISGKQRMLSQKTTLFVKRSFESNDEKIFNHLVDLVNLMKSDYKFIINRLTSKNMEDIYFSEPLNIDKNTNEYFSLLDKYLQLKDKQLIKEIEDKSFTLLPILNKAVYAFENEINEKTVELQKRELYILIGALVTLFLEAIFIVIPSIRASEKSVEELENLNSNLEKRVKEELDIIKKKDELLYHQSKMVTISKLIDNIAHYWRQPLSLITTSASGLLLKKEYGHIQEGDLEKSLKDIVDNSLYLSETIEKYRSLFEIKKGKTIFKMSEISQKAKDIISDKILEYHIKTVDKIDDIKFSGYESDLIQIFFYIYDNAKDTLIEREIKSKLIFTKIIKNDDFILISIYDNAQGIKREDLTKIFQPYFTTKKEKVGNGMDLFVAKQILKESFNGEILVSNYEYIYEDKEYTGAKFDIKIPIN